jgi:FKBP-type peptidyl-prolyl cis-trans isomerase
MSSFALTLDKNGKSVEVEVKDSLIISTLILDTIRKVKGTVQVKAKTADSKDKEAQIIGTLSNDSNNCTVNITFSSKNSPVEFSITGNGKVTVSGTVEQSSKKTSKKRKADENEQEPKNTTKSSKTTLQSKESAAASTATVAAATKEAAKKESLPHIVNMKKPWGVKPQNDEGVLVSKPKAVYKVKGLKVIDYVIGNGPIPGPGAAVKIVYSGLLPDGSTFDARLKRSAPLVFRKGVNQVVKGMDIGLEGMRVGGSREITVPSDLG